jgi:ElaB/YqjD/DUF883 family membrane-anchored ribosome-binding protein
MTTQTGSGHAASGTAEQIIGKAERSARDALDGAADLARQASAAGAEAAGTAAGKVDSAVRSGLRSSRSMAKDATADAAGYIRERPLQALLVAAAAGTAALAIIGLLARSRNRG